MKSRWSGRIVGDFDFIVRTLARSQTDQVSLVDLLSDVETRDSIRSDLKLHQPTADDRDGVANCGGKYR